MNFDEDEESDFSFNTQQSGNKFASLFNMNDEQGNSETLKFKAPKQPQQIATQTATSQESKKSSVSFFTNVQAFKYISNRHELQGKLGLAVISSQNTYKLLLYVSKAQPLSIIRISTDFKIALQKNNYSSFYDEDRQLWSVLFETEDLLAAFATNIFLCKINLQLENVKTLPSPVKQDLCNNDAENAAKVEDNDSIEAETVVTIVKDGRLSSVIENTKGAPTKLRLGRNKIPKLLEEMLINTKQGDRKLFAFMGKHLQAYFSDIIDSDSIVFYEIKILRIKKNDRKDRSLSNASTIDQVPLPQLTAISQQLDDSRSRTNSIKEKSKNISSQLNEPKLDKQRLISRIAKMGQQMMPKNDGEMHFEYNNESENERSEISSEKQSLDGFEAVHNNKQNMLHRERQQQQLLQQQMHLQNQFLSHQQNSDLYQTNNQQLALFKNPHLLGQNNAQLVMYPQDSIIQSQVQQQSPKAQNQPSNDIDASKIVQKLDAMNEKLENINSISKINQQNLPTMETNVLLQNIQRIVKENEQYKKDLYEKSNKIEEQNGKITELLVKAQTYVEQSHQFLEQKNNSYQSNSEKNAQRILELEQDKMHLTGDLSKLTAQISDLNLEINRVQKVEAENKSQLIEVSKNSDMYKQNSERLIVENADIQTKLDNCLAEFKKEKQLRKSLEAEKSLKDEEINELRASLATNQKQAEEKKRKFDTDRSNFESEMEEIKSVHILDINEMKEKLNKFKSKTSENQQEMFKQTELELNNEWQSKLDKSILQLEQKNDRSIKIINDQKDEIENQLVDAKDVIRNFKNRFSVLESEKDGLNEKVDELVIIKEKYERLQNQALLIKERYETRIKELIEADPDPEVICDEVKKVMNSIYRQIKLQIKPEEYYSGNGILIGMLKIIKVFTIRILQQITSDDEEDQDKFNFFSQHILEQENMNTAKNFEQQPSIDVVSTTYIVPVESSQHQTSQIDTNMDQKTNQTLPTSQKLFAHNKTEHSEQVNKESDSITKKSTSIETDTQSMLNEIESDEGRSSPEIVTNKIIDSSDDDGDDKSIQAINDEDQNDNEIVLNQSIIRNTIIASNILKENIGLIASESNKPTNMEVYIEKENYLNQNDDDDDDDEIDKNIESVKDDKQSVNQELVQKSDISDKEKTLEQQPIEMIAEPVEYIDEPVESIDEPVESVDEPAESLKESAESKIDNVESKVESDSIEEPVKQISLKPIETNVATQEQKTVNAQEKAKIPVLSRGLFDDSDDEEDDSLFSFTANKPENLTKSAIVSPANSSISNQKGDSMTKSLMTPFKSNQKETSSSLKFSPPPLFDEEEDNNDKEEIDWFK